SGVSTAVENLSAMYMFNRAHKTFQLRASTAACGRDATPRRRGAQPRRPRFVGATGAQQWICSHLYDRRRTPGREAGSVRSVDQRQLRAAADAYAAARDEVRVARNLADAAWVRLQASQDTLEYQIDWSSASKREAAAVARLEAAKAAYRDAGGYAAGDPEE
ncbi:MAG: hypothetical protein ACLPTJ_06165, partial [Solirubrobacteraceae bacterium]